MQTAADQIILLPGEHLVAGRPSCFNMDLRNDFLACVAKLQAPADLAALTDDEARALKYPAIRIYALSRGRDDFLARVEADLFRRGFDSAGRRVELQVAA